MDKEKELLKVLFLLTTVWKRDLKAGLSAGNALLAYQQGRVDALQAVIDCAGYTQEFEKMEVQQCKRA